jgi:hypothetical protein
MVMDDPQDQTGAVASADDDFNGGPHDHGGPDPLDPDPDLHEAEEPEMDLPPLEDEVLLSTNGAIAVDEEPDLTSVAPLEDRLDRLETSLQELAAAEAERERSRVRRKVTAATAGAGTVGFVPALLQLAGAFDLSPELTAALSSIAAAVGALVVGYFTPERKPPPTPHEAGELLSLVGR